MTPFFSGSSRAMVLASGLLAASQANAVSYYLDQSNDLPDGTNYATVEIETLLDGRIQFTVDALDPPFIPDTNFGIQAFGFNVDDNFTDPNGPTLTDIANNITVLNDPDNKWKVKIGQNNSEFGVYDESTSGTGSTRKDPLVFTIDMAGDTVSTYAQSNGTSWFSAHIAGFSSTPCSSDSGTCTSAWFSGGGDATTPPQAVPVPAAAWLFGTGLLGLAGVARRKV